MELWKLLNSVKSEYQIWEFARPFQPMKATTDGSQAVTAAIFWLKTRGGWRETPQDHRVGIVDLTQLSDAELESMIAEHLATLRKAPSARDRLLIEGN